MSLNKEELLRKVIRELVRKELNEANSSSSAGGNYETPHAFKGDNKKGKKKGKAGYTGGHGDPSHGTGHFVAKDPDLRGGPEGKKGKKYLPEGKYHDWRNDDSLTPKQKIGIAMRETRDSLSGLEKIVGYNVRLKNETNTPSSGYWKNTIKAISKIDERLKRLSLKIKEMT